MPFHWLDLLPILLIALVVIGPKAFQSVARNVGKGVGEAKTVKDSVVSDLPVNDLIKMARRIPTSPQHALQMLLMPEPEEKPKDTKKEERWKN